MPTSLSKKVSQHDVVDVPNEYVDSEDGQLSSHFTMEEIKILKHIVSNPIFNVKNVFEVKVKKVDPSLNGILESVASYYKVTVAKIKGSQRSEILINARRDFCHLAFIKTKKSFTTIGKTMNRTYPTVSYYIKQKSVNSDKINAETY